MCTLRSETIFDNWKPFKMMKNAFYFILEALFVLKIFKFLSWPFAKLRAFCAYALYVPTCLRASNYYVPTCLRALNHSRAYVPLLFTCLHAYILHVLTCLQPPTKYTEAHFYTLRCCFSLDYLQYLTFHSIQYPKINPYF